MTIYWEDIQILVSLKPSADERWVLEDKKRHRRLWLRSLIAAGGKGRWEQSQSLENKELNLAKVHKGFLPQ